MHGMRVKLTDAFVRAAAIPPDRDELMLWDSEVRGFGLRVRKATKSYIVVFRPAGAGRSATMRRVRLGTPETLRTASEARRLALAVLGRVAAGADPAKERAEEKRRERSRVDRLLDAYEADLERRAYVSRKAVMSTLRRGLNAHRAKENSSVRGANLAAVIRRLEAAGRLGAAEDFRARCRTFLTWCTFEAKVIDHNPLAGYRKSRGTRSERLARADRGQALSDEELARVWQAADPARTFGRYVRYLILTGCRRGEGSGLTREMVDRTTRCINLPATFTKQARGHVVYVAPPLDEVLSACVHDSRSELVFPSPRTGDRMSGWTRMVASIAKNSGVDFTLHDLRRTFRTGLSRLGIQSDVAELALGHARGDLDAIYNQNTCAAELRSAFEKWAEYVVAVSLAREPLIPANT